MAVAGALNRYALNTIEFNGSSEIVEQVPIVVSTGTVVIYAGYENRGMVVPGANRQMYVS